MSEVIEREHRQAAPLAAVPPALSVVCVPSQARDAALGLLYLHLSSPPIIHHDGEFERILLPAF